MNAVSLTCAVCGRTYVGEPTSGLRLCRCGATVPSQPGTLGDLSRTTTERVLRTVFASLSHVEADAVTDAICDWAENEACSLADMDDSDVPVQRAALLVLVQGVVDRLNAARASLAEVSP